MLDFKSYFAINYLLKSYMFNTGVRLMKKTDASSIKNEKLWFFLCQVVKSLLIKIIEVRSTLRVFFFKQKQVLTKIQELKIGKENK